MSKPVALTIATSDSGGGAGIQADIKAMEANGVFATSALAAITAQNTETVAQAHDLPTDLVTAQIDAVAEDMDVRAVKTGMLYTAEIIEAVAERVGAVHAANARAFADFMGNHYARRVETATAAELREFLTEYYPRNAWPSDEQRDAVERSLEHVFSVTETDSRDRLQVVTDRDGQG